MTSDPTLEVEMATIIGGRCCLTHADHQLRLTPEQAGFRHIVSSLVTDEFDLSTFQDKPLDHGFFSRMSVLLEREDGQWPTTVVPLQVGVLPFPIPAAARCYKLGKALRRAIESYPEDVDVAVVSTGGLSHQVHGEGNRVKQAVADVVAQQRACGIDFVGENSTRHSPSTRALIATFSCACWRAWDRAA